MSSKTGLDDTIVAIATPPGRGAVAMVRLSGARAHSIARACVTPWPSQGRKAVLCAVRGRNDEVIDRALVTVFTAPHSFTGEDTIEICTHGGLVAPALVVAELIAQGARQALPGEFTRRAVLNGKIDLMQAEAIGDLIDAGSRAMHRVAVQQLDGGLSARVVALREMIIGVEALIAYDIDFPEEDDGPISRSRITTAIHEVLSALDTLLATAPAGEIVRAGAVVVIAGAPNAGKSSLFNALLGTERAIVTEIPGTTRDAIEAVIDIGTWPVRLVDTAGLRDTDDTVERIGIEVSTRYLGSADAVIVCSETDEGVQESATHVAQLTQAPILTVRTKRDVHPSSAPLQISAVTGTGIPELLAAIEAVLNRQHGSIAWDAPLLTRERHRQAITMAREEMASFAEIWNVEALPAPVAAVHLRTAAHALEDLIGNIDLEDVFDRLFRTFCIGK